MQTTGDSLGVFAEDTRAFFDDLVYARVATSCSSKDYGGQHRDLHFVRCLGPANKLVKIVQRKRVQDFRSELHLTTAQIIFAQDQAQRLNGEEKTAAGIAQDVSPPTGPLDSVASSASHRRTTSSIDDNAVSIVQGRRQAGITIAARHNFRIWPNVSANERERLAIFLGATTGKKNSRAIDFPWQSRKNFAQTFRGCQAQIGRRQLSLIENHPLRAGFSAPGYGSFN
jgi:hypothetical protein